MRVHPEIDDCHVRPPFIPLSLEASVSQEVRG
jgi:hypothetical protein